MRQTHINRGLWTALTLLALSITAGIGLCQIQPAGRKAGLIQFDVISELNMLSLGWPTWPNRVVFARYWVCEDYYAVAVVWTEPYQERKTLIVFSDETSFRIDDEDLREYVAVNTTYRKPLGERGPFPVRNMLGSTPPFVANTRLAEAEAASRRVYVDDLGPAKSRKPGADETIDVNVPKGPGGVTRKLARLKVHARGDRIESMELFDSQKRQLGTMKYEYETDGNLTKLTADWPERPEKLLFDVNDGFPKSLIDYVSHKGGRTATVAYSNITVGGRVLRLPVRVEVRRGDDKQLLRSAKLTNFKQVNLDKAGVWKAAKTFAGLSSEDHALARLRDKYLEAPPRKPRPLQVDPNDVAAARRLIAKYPVPEVSKPPDRPWRRAPVERVTPDVDPNMGPQQMRIRQEARKRESAQRREEIKAWREQATKAPKLKQMTVEPSDARAIRERIERYDDMLVPPPLTEQEKTKYASQEWVDRNPTEDEQEIRELRNKLEVILNYHRIPHLPEDKPKAVEPNELDLKLICQLQGHYEKLTVQQDKGLGGQLRALGALTQLDWILHDYDAIEGHTVRYLQMTRDASLVPMHMVGGFECIRFLMKAGQYDKANKLMRQWADRSGAENDADTIFRFVNMKGRGPVLSWASVQVLDRFLERPGLSPVQRYEALALRAINLDRIDRFLADPEASNPGRLVTDPEADKNESRGVNQWILSTTTRAGIGKLVEPAIRQAVSAWGALGPARLSEAKPYSTENMSPRRRNVMEAPDATRLQETSAQLDQIVSQRFGQKGTSPGPRESGRSAPTRQ
jgi:hypothetical protein